MEISPQDHDRIIQMAWEDRTPFEAIQFQFGLTQGQTIHFMRSQLQPSSFKLWRKRVNQGISIKHGAKRSDGVTRFKSRMQRTIAGNKISKR